MKRIAVSMCLILLSLPFPRAAHPASPSGAWLDEVARTLEERVADAKRQAEKSGATAADAERKAGEARAAGSPSESTFRKAADNARKARDRAVRLEEEAGRKLAAVRRLRAAFDAGTDPEVAACSAVYGQLQQDIEVNRRYAKEIERAQAELAEWTEKNKAALWEGAKACIELVAGTAAEAIGKRLDRATQLRDGVRNMEEQLVAKYGRANFNKLVAKLEVTSRSYESAFGTIRRLDWTKYPGAAADGITYYDQFTNGVSVAANRLAEGDRHLAEAMADPEFDRILNREFPGVDLATFTAEEATKFFLKKVGMSALPVTYADFAFKSILVGTDLYHSRQRILQQIEVTEQQLKAVEALKKQLTRSMEAYRKCRADILAREGITD